MREDVAASGSSSEVDAWGAREGARAKEVRVESESGCEFDRKEFVGSFFAV
jgi:hypothetical protein